MRLYRILVLSLTLLTALSSPGARCLAQPHHQSTPANRSPVVTNGPAQPVVQPAAGDSAHSNSPGNSQHVQPHAQHFEPKTTPIEVTGEVVDSWCYASQVMGPGRGERHKACALACAYGGVTLGIVDDAGTLYIAAKHKGYTGCKELLVPFIAKRVKVTGWLATKGGCKLLKIKSVVEVH